MDAHYKFPASRLKTDQFFLHWLAQPDNQELVRSEYTLGQGIKNHISAYHSHVNSA